MVSAIGGTIWEYNSDKTAYRTCNHRHSVGYRTVEPYFAPNRGILWQYRRNKQSKQALLSETAKISPADLQQKDI